MGVHISVMPKEALELLKLPKGGVAVDGTLGMAGHAVLMAEALGPQGHLIGVDRDSASLKLASEKLGRLALKIDCPSKAVEHHRGGMDPGLNGYRGRVHLLQGSFSELDVLLADLKVSAVDGILLDLGISSFQLDDPGRGFSFMAEGPLDMRMDATKGKSAEDLVNILKQGELERIIHEFGEERFARRIAAAIVAQRSKSRITSTKNLAEIVLRALPKGYTRGRIHPATRTFQALRIAVNQELDVLAKGLDVCFKGLKQGGRLCVISFHSLEDRIVKNKFKSLSAEGQGVILTKKPLEATEEECKANPRSRSAKLRAIERAA